MVANKYSRSGQSSAPVNPVHVGEAASATPSAPHVVGRTCKSHGRHRLSPKQPEAPFRFCFNMVLYRAPYMGKKLENVPDAA